MPLPDADPTVASTFELQVDGVVFAGLTEVSGLTREQDVVEMKQTGPDGKYVIRRLPGQPKPGVVTVTRPLTADTAFEGWFTAHTLDATDAKAASTGSTASLVVRSSSGENVRTYVLVNAWPSKLEIGAVKHDDTGVLTERLLIAYERIEIE